MFFKMHLCNAMIIKLSRRSSLAVDRKRDFMVSSCSFSATTKQECCINMWNLEMLITGNDHQMVCKSRLIPLLEIKCFQIYKELWNRNGNTDC